MAVAVGVALVVGAGRVAWVTRRGRSEAPPRRTGPPNLLFIMSDDQRWDSLGQMPKTQRRFTVKFQNFFVTTPLCCPSRSSFLSGEYARHTHVTNNDAYPKFQVREPQSLGPWLQARGYYTGFVGKYFNHYRSDEPAPVGWDEFYARVWGPDSENLGDGFTSFSLRERWLDGNVARDGIVSYPNSSYPTAYSTTVTSDIAARFIDRAADPRYNPEHKPWALLVWPNAPNGPTPEPKYANAAIPPWIKPPSFLEPDMSDKPEEVVHGPARNNDVPFLTRKHDAQLRMILSIDDMVERLYRRLGALGEQADTWGIYTSDNGRLFGEHHLNKKLYAYEESIRVPFLMDIPGHGPEELDQLVANIDVAPTLLDLAGDHADHGFDGRSLVPLVQDRSAAWRSAILIENFIHVKWKGVRTARWKYIRWRNSGDEELYDLEADPYELQNVAGSRPGVVARLRAMLPELAGPSP